MVLGQFDLSVRPTGMRGRTAGSVYRLVG